MNIKRQGSRGDVVRRTHLQLRWTRETLLFLDGVDGCARLNLLPIDKGLRPKEAHLNEIQRRKELGTHIGDDLLDHASNKRVPDVFRGRADPAIADSAGGDTRFKNY